MFCDKDARTRRAPQVVRKLTSYVEASPLQAVTCLNKIARAPVEWWNFSLWKDASGVVLRKALHSENSEARALADALIQHFGQKRIEDFRHLLDQDRPPGSHSESPIQT